jgi:Tfp pilus assembly protein PilN
MVIINLLPWRESKRIYQARIMKTILIITLFATVASIAGLHEVIVQWNNSLDSQIARLKEEMKIYIRPKESSQKKIKTEQKGAIISGSTLKNLLNFRLATKNLIVELGKWPAQDVCLTTISRDKNVITFSGKAHSAAELTAFLKTWKAAYLFSDITLDDLAQKENNTIQFRFQALANHSYSFPIH